MAARTAAAGEKTIPAQNEYRRIIAMKAARMNRAGFFMVIFLESGG
jgi:hypothetical protein